MCQCLCRWAGTLVMDWIGSRHRRHLIRNNVAPLSEPHKSPSGCTSQSTSPLKKVAHPETTVQCHEKARLRQINTFRAPPAVTFKMAKAAKPKQTPKGTLDAKSSPRYLPACATFLTSSQLIANPRSRAAKRATSPSIDTDKSLKEGPRASDATPMLTAKPYAGITKSKKKQKSMTRGQRKRQERGLDRAVVVQDQLVKKFGDVQKRQKKIRERKGLWEDANGRSNFDKLANTAFAEEDNDADGGSWEDEEMEEVQDLNAHVKIVDGVKLPASAAATKLVVVDRTASGHNTDTDNDLDFIT